ncbi:hypothetical protein C8N32_10457 [Rhodovulum imhoffii]|uniref:Glycosyl transferase family 52 n=1 Tax=Rhodovulum imhoffii TaxID=365340 RepID=A0A2T5BU27_9RHOB|nr:polysialyltransferase family glycosyltransferase [Rhodovulum imhoffii]MBK5932739.1 hypothetical protein [Rhodovulum imhoffii]PTN02946.1 hypothetical protein C8N32_10457 [Rhodovulum imhoffii]
MAEPLPDLYVVPSSRPLFYTLISILSSPYPAEIVYLADYAPIPEQVIARLHALMPQTPILIRRDCEAAEEFASLPGGLPAILRRNWAPRPGAWFAGPAAHPPAWLRPAYRDAYIFTTGHFLPKTLRHRCQRIILREEGLGTYHSLPISFGKALLRGLWGRSPRYHFMGEEPWVDRIEVAAPQSLPPALAAKASRLDMTGLIQTLPERTRHDLARVFWSGSPISRIGATAVILTQPIDRPGLCSPREKEVLYERMAQILRRRGYRVLIKRHPQEHARIDGQNGVPAFFPIEAWPCLSDERFALAVSLCSSALDRHGPLFACRSLQLVTPEAFARGDLSGWDARLETALTEGLS